MIRQALSSVIGHPRIRKTIISTPGIRDLAWRFVAGESLDAGVSAVRQLNACGISGTLNYIGTHVRNESEALAATDMAVQTLRRIDREGLEANLSLKLTQIGLDIDESFCRSQLQRILMVAREVGSFVRIDMEETPYVDSTLRIFDDMREALGPETVGIVLQSYLRDREKDLDRQLLAGSRIRLVKGGYWESPEMVLRRKSDIESAFERDVEKLLAKGNKPAIATHDGYFLNRACQLAADASLPPDSFELQLLYGVRPDLQKRLKEQGYAVRCYVPFGGNWYAYVLGCIRRIPEEIVRYTQERFRSQPD